MTFTTHMEAALAEARTAGRRDEVPVGAVVVSPRGAVIAAAGNRTRELNDPTAHAEMLAIRAACAALGVERLVDQTAAGRPEMRQRGNQVLQSHVANSLRSQKSGDRRQEET